MSANRLVLQKSPVRRAATAMLTLGSLVALVLAVFAPAPAEAATVRSISPALAQIAGEALDAVSQLDVVDDTQSYDRHPLTYTRYVRLRDEAANLAAAELGLPAARLRDAWALSDLDKQTALLAALTQLGVPYRTNSSEPGVGFDCSGLTTYAWGVAGHDLARQSRAQINASTRVERNAAEAGDLMYYPGHVMMYLGIDDAMVHSRQRGSDVEITFLTGRHSSNVVFADPTL
jgi:cell wall-associated NlpC family hydrolase